MKAMQVNNAKAVGEAARELDMAVAVGAWESEGLHIFLSADTSITTGWGGMTPETQLK